jgi:hypothetical protein
MQMKEHQAVNGVLTIVVRDAAGRPVDERRVHNLVTKGGRKLLADLLMGKADAVPSRWSIALGSGTDAPTPGDVGLKTPVSNAQVEIDSPKVELIDNSDGTSTVRGTVSGTLPAPTTAAATPLTEAGIQVGKKGSDTWTLFNRVVFPVVSWGTGMSMTLNWEITF